MDGAHGAGFHTFAAADAFVIIDVRGIVLDFNRIAFANLGAFHAADTADFALFAGKGAFVVVFAKHRRFGFIKRDKLDKPFRAGRNAFFARLAGKRVHARHAVANLNGVIRAGLDAVAVT